MTVCLTVWHDSLLRVRFPPSSSAQALSNACRVYLLRCLTVEAMREWRFALSEALHAVVVLGEAEVQSLRQARDRAADTPTGIHLGHTFQGSALRA